MDKEVIKKITIDVNADRVRFSQILALKDLFRSYPGKSPIEMHFHVGKSRLGSVMIDPQWGVKADSEFEKKLNNLGSELGFTSTLK